MANALARIVHRKAGIGVPNPYLDRAASGQIVERVIEYTGATPAVVMPCPHTADGARLDVSSHGLFVADIIKDIAPGAEVWVYRVLGNDGVGDLHTIAAAVKAAIADATTEDGQKPLILNLSLGFGPQLALLDKLLSDPKLTKGDLAAWQKAVDEMQPPASATAEEQQLEQNQIVVQRDGRYSFVRGLELIDHVFAATGGRTNVLAVAATGNDSKDGTLPFGPRVPAAIDSVLAAAAFQPPAGEGGDWDRVGYSNNDALFPGNDGIGAYGGKVVSESGVPLSRNGLIGLYAGDTIPEYLPGKAPAARAEPAANDTGWAMWSGSSFAAPIAAGFAACLWSEKMRQAGASCSAGEIFELVLRSRPSLPFRQKRH